MILPSHVEGEENGPGGPAAEQMILAFPYEHYQSIMSLLGRRVFIFGQFGEHLTTGGLLESSVRIGDRFRMGGALLEVACPGLPGSELSSKMGTDRMIQPLLESGHTGFWLRVVEPGTARRGDPIELIHSDPESLTVSDVEHAWIHPEPENDALAERAANLASLAPEWRSAFAARLHDTTAVAA